MDKPPPGPYAWYMADPTDPPDPHCASELVFLLDEWDLSLDGVCYGKTDMGDDIAVYRDPNGEVHHYAFWLHCSQMEYVDLL